MQTLSIGDTILMIKLFLDLITLAPGVVGIVQKALTDFEAATSIEQKTSAVLAALEALSAEIKAAL